MSESNTNKHHNLARMKKYSLCLVLAIFAICVSCTSEDTMIKKALKASIKESLQSEYKYDSHLLLETILKTNLTDSISSYKTEIRSSKEMMRLDSLRLDEIRYNLRDCKLQKSNTLYFLRSMYDTIIEEYEGMEEELITKLEDKSVAIAEKEVKVKFWSQAMAETDSPIVFYKVKHAYKMRGMYQDTVVVLNSKYEIVK